MDKTSNKFHNRKQCAICGEMIHPRRVHNAEPVVDGVCCDKCNYAFVVPARIRNERKNK